MKYFVLFIFILFICVTFETVVSIPDGQRMSIQKVPFIAIAEGVIKGNYKRFSGVILDEKLILTLEVLVNA